MSMAGQETPRYFCTMQDTEGDTSSPLTVVHRMRSSSSGLVFPASRARLALSLIHISGIPFQRCRRATPYFTGLNNVRFKNPVRPGDTFETECRIVRTSLPFLFAEGKGYVNGKLCVKAE